MASGILRMGKGSVPSELLPADVIDFFNLVRSEILAGNSFIR